MLAYCVEQTSWLTRGTTQEKPCALVFPELRSSAQESSVIGTQEQAPWQSPFLGLRSAAVGSGTAAAGSLAQQHLKALVGRWLGAFPLPITSSSSARGKRLRP